VGCTLFPRLGDCLAQASFPEKKSLRATGKGGKGGGAGILVLAEEDVGGIEEAYLAAPCTRLAAGAPPRQGKGLVL